MRKRSEGDAAESAALVASRIATYDGRMEHTAPLQPPTGPIVVRHTKDLERSAREWFEQQFGRPLRDDENLTVVLSAPHAAPSLAERRAAFHRIERILDRAADNMRDVPDEEFEVAADEAMKQIRPTFEP